MSSSDEVRPAARSAGPLDRIEERCLLSRERGLGEYVLVTAEVGLALVNVAKAAEENVWMGEDPEVERGDLQRAWRQMGEALAALNKID